MAFMVWSTALVRESVSERRSIPTDFAFGDALLISFDILALGLVTDSVYLVNASDTVDIGTVSGVRLAFINRGHDCNE